MQYVNLIQGSQEWLAHRRNHFNASDAPAMRGVSSYKSRDQLIKELATGITPDVDEATQYIFDNGHRIEALARPLAKDIVGEDLYPVVGVNGKFSASFDGLTMDESVNFEHKTLNESLRSIVNFVGQELPIEYRIQMEHQMMVSGSEKTLFMASKWDGDTLIEERHCWYTPDLELRAKIVAGWAQIELDVADYVPAPEAAKLVAESITDLPAIFIQTNGAITISDNFKAFEIALRNFLDNRLIREPKTDQDFADLDAQIKTLKKSEDALDAAESHMLSQVEAIDQAKRAKDMLHKLTRDNRLMAEKLLAARKEVIKGEIVAGGIAAFRDHVNGLNARLGKAYMPTITADFAGVIKGKRTIESLNSAVNDELARAKIAANEVADRIQINLSVLTSNACKHSFLFFDTAQIVTKANDDFEVLVSSRIAAHDAAEAARLEREREAIRAEEVAKLERAAKKAEQVKATPTAVTISEPSLPVPTTTAVIAQSKTLPLPSRPTDIEIIQSLSASFKAPMESVLEWLTDLDFDALTEEIMEAA
jgi:putative phage-type endonuclease